MYCVVYSDHVCMLTTCNCWLWHWVIICGGQIRVGVCSVYFLSCFIFCFKFRKFWYSATAYLLQPTINSGVY